jgi:Zinc knuckle
MEKAIQFDTNWRIENLFFNPDMKVSSSKKADTNKSNGNACWWRINERKDPNAMDVDALTMEEKAMLLRQEKCFCCKEAGHIAKDCSLGAGAVLETEEGRPGKICLHHNQSAHQGAEREFYKGGHREQG